MQEWWSPFVRGGARDLSCVFVSIVGNLLQQEMLTFEKLLSYRVLLSSSQSHVGWQWEGGDGSSPGIHGSWLLLSNSLWALRPWILLSMCLSNRRRQKQYVGDPMRSFNVPDWKAENIASAQSPTVRISGIKSDLPLVGLGQASELCARRKDTLVLVALIRIWSFLS